MLTDVVAARYDAGIRIGRLVSRDMIAVRISDPLRLVVAASPDYLARHQAPKTPKDLQAHNCIRLRFPGGAFLPWRFVIEGDWRPPFGSLQIDRYELGRHLRQ
jgi:DNA-binding transcriptional LysR family regulator